MGLAMRSELLRQIRHRLRERRALRDLRARQIGTGAPHGLPAPLVVTLTSYARRFPTLGPTLQGILAQDMRPDRVVLWLEPQDRGQLPAEILALQAHGLELADCGALRSYNKIIPALQAFPDAYLLTADDDVYYPQGWLRGLVAASASSAGGLICHRAHRITCDAAGAPLPYRDWPRNLTAPERGPQVFPTGVMGVIYPPGSLSPETLRSDLFMALAPTADDVWLRWMHRLAGAVPEKIGERCRIHEWRGSQAQNLRNINTGRPDAGGVAPGNDRAVAAMVARYGLLM